AALSQSGDERRGCCQAQGYDDRQYPDAPHGRGGGSGQGRAVPRVRRCLFHHRRQSLRRWRFAGAALMADFNDTTPFEPPFSGIDNPRLEFVMEVRLTFPEVYTMA